MMERFKTISAALPLIAVVAIGMVYVRAWAIFRQYDADWLTTLSAADIFSMGWAMTPTMLIAGAVGVSVGHTAGKESKSREPRPVGGWKITLYATSAFFIILSYAIMMVPLGVRLPDRLLHFYPLTVLWLTFLHSHAAFRVTTTLASFAKIAGLAGAAAMVAFWDWEGAARLDQPTLKRITLDDGRELCSALVFSGQNTMFLWDPLTEKATALERRLAASVTKDPDCKVEPRQRAVTPTTSPALPTQNSQ